MKFSHNWPISQAVMQAICTLKECNNQECMFCESKDTQQPRMHVLQKQNTRGLICYSR